MYTNVVVVQNLTLQISLDLQSKVGTVVSKERIRILPKEPKSPSYCTVNKFMQS